jgi:hypothetical protein
MGNDAAPMRPTGEGDAALWRETGKRHARGGGEVDVQAAADGERAREAALMTDGEYPADVRELISTREQLQSQLARVQDMLRTLLQRDVFEPSHRASARQ